MQDTPQVSAGWYPQDGQQRYWDGTQWTDHVAPPTAVQIPDASNYNGVASDERTMALLAYLLRILVSFVAPLIIYFVKKDESPFVRRHTAEILNHYITMLCAVFAAIAVIVVGVVIAQAVPALGIIIAVVAGLAILGLGMASFVWTIMGAIKANRGEDFRFPINWRLIT